MEVTSLPNLNLITAQCGCCPLPTCADPKIICESLTHKTNCGDNDYTDSHDLWLKLSTDHASWASTHAAFPAAHAAWVTAHAAWAMEDPCERGPEPVEPVDPPEPPTGGTEPPEPEGYDDYEYSCLAPFAEPEGEPEDDLPTLYTRRKGEVTNKVNGSGWSYVSGSGTSPLSAEYLSVGTYTDYWDAGAVESYTGNRHDKTLNTCEALSGDGIVGSVYVGPFGAEYGEAEILDVCEANRRGSTSTSLAAEGDPSPPSLLGCPGLGVDFDEDSSFGYSYELVEESLEVLSAPVTKSSLIARAIDNIPATWPDIKEGSSCSALTTVLWPKIKDLYTGANPEADPPVEASWPDHCDLFSGYASVPVTFAESTKTRYKMGIPLLYQAHRLWIIEHAEWVACDALGCIPDICGAEPVEPQIFHYYAIQWDVVFFPKKWEEWRVLWLAWKAAVVAHDRWVIDHAAWVTAGSDPETEPEEPAVPDDPTADQPEDGPVFINENLFWVWTGGETEAEQYETDWHTIDAPTTEGESRIVNKQVKCWQSARIGVPPSPVGEIYNPADYE